jgi:acyl-coenzyme A thioesterase PaaI-like protein
MKVAVTEEELTDLLANVPFIKSYGFTLAGISEGVCTIFVPFQSVFERPGGIVSGVVFMAAADVAMWLAIKTKLGLTDGSLTAEMKTSFLSGAKNEDFHCTARVLKFGQRLIYGLAECVNDHGTLLTHHTLTYIRHHSAPPTPKA